MMADGATDAVAQVFRCHIKCGCSITYRFRSGDGVVTKNVDSVADEDGLRSILEGALGGSPDVAAAAEASVEAAEPARPKVLVVDDDEEFAMLVATALARRGFEVTTADGAEEGLSAVARDRPDALVLDVMMEHFDSGFALAKEIRARYGHIPAVFVSAIGHETGIDFVPRSDEQRQRMGADAFLDKGVTPDQLASVIRQLLAAREGG